MPPRFIAPQLLTGSAPESRLEPLRLAIFGELVRRSLHEFRNAQTIVGGNLALLETAGDPLREEDRIALRDALAAFRQGETILGALQSLAQRGGAEQALDLNATCTDLAAMLNAALPKLPPLTVIPAPDLPPVRARRADLAALTIALVLAGQERVAPGGSLALETHAAECRDAGPPCARLVLRVIPDDRDPAGEPGPWAGPAPAPWLLEAGRALAAGMNGRLGLPSRPGGPWVAAIPLAVR